MKPRVLVVEDNPIISKITGRTLERFGCNPEYACNGQEALTKFHECEYDLILMDVCMPVMNGIEATRMIRNFEACEGNKHVPIVAVTAAAEKEECLEAGMDDHLVKPPNYELILRRWLPQLFPAATPRCDLPDQKYNFEHAAEHRQAG